MLLFPKKYSERARLINDRLVRLISILENYPAYKPLIDSLLKERSDEFDVGQGIAGVTVAEARIESGMLSYEDLSRLSLFVPHKLMIIFKLKELSLILQKLF